MDQPHSRDGPTGSERVGALRRLVLFVLGIAVTIDALVGAAPHVGQLLVGALLLGLIPVDELMERLWHRSGGR